MVRKYERNANSINLMPANKRLERYQENMRKIREIAPSKEIAKLEPIYYGDHEGNHR